jgi:hypothetical protein
MIPLRVQTETEENMVSECGMQLIVAVGSESNDHASEDLLSCGQNDDNLLKGL